MPKAPPFQKKSNLPKDANYLMRPEDRSAPGDDPTADENGAGGPPIPAKPMPKSPPMTPPAADEPAPTEAPTELTSAIDELVQQYGADAVKQACDESYAESQGGQDTSGDESAITA